MNKKSQNKSLKKRASWQRTDTCRKVETAIQDLLDEGFSKREIKRKDILERTGLSSGTLSKPYVREVLEKHQVCQFKDKQSVSLSDNEIKKGEIVEMLRSEIKKLKSKQETLQLELERYKERLYEANQDSSKQKERIERLTGKLQDALEVIYVLNPEKLNSFHIV